jgi:hypothetical protein
MHPLFLGVAAIALMTGRKKKKGVGVSPPAPPNPVRRRAFGNGKAPERWTRLPWEPQRVTGVISELIEKGERDPERLALAAAKTLYPVDPATGAAFTWPAEQDVGAEIALRRIRLRARTLLAAAEEAEADEAAQEVGVTPSGEPESDEAKAAVPDSPRIGRLAPPPVLLPDTLPTGRRRRPLTLRGGAKTRRAQPGPQVDARMFFPEDNAPIDGVYHRVTGNETVHGIARAALFARTHTDPTDEQVAHYVSLIVCSPENDLPTTWDEKHEIPGAAPFPWGADRPMIWLPKLNEDRLAAGIVTTLQVTWSDGSNGISAPPEAKKGRGDG